MKTHLLGILFACSLFLSPVATAQNNLLTNGGFETGDLSGWTAVDTGNGAFTVYTGTTAPISSIPIPPPPFGAFAALTDQDGPGSHILYQDVTIPDNGEDYFLSFNLYYNNTARTWINNGTLSEVTSPNQHMRVDIMDPSAPADDVGAGVLQNIFITADPNPFEFGYSIVGANLTAFAGQTVRLRFAEVDNQSNFLVGVDEVVIGVQQTIPVNQPVALALLVLSMMLVAGFYIRRSHLAG